MWKKRLAFLAVILGVCALSSRLFNFPLHFKHERRFTAHSQDPVRAATAIPDNIVLTPAGDMRTGIRITWRTAESVPDGAVQFAASETRATERTLHSPELTSDNRVKYFTATLDGLTPGTKYAYRVGSPSLGIWSDYATLTTAPDAEDSFSFAYFGDTQRKPKPFGDMLAVVRQRHPETALYMMGGDIVDAGDCRNLWDDFMPIAAPYYSRIPVAPAMGNHDYGTGGDGVETFALQFGLPVPGNPRTLAGYSFRRGKAFFAVLNFRKPGLQAHWLERELRKAREEGCVFTIVVFHEPVYNPKENRRNSGAQNRLVPLFDKYGVDIVLNAHDHSYLRSKPLRAGKAAPEGEPGTTYIVATSCDKFYKFRNLDIAETQFADVATYQLITLGSRADGRRFLRYAAHAPDGTVVDSFETIKEKALPCQ